MEELVVLYRPVGCAELELIRASGFAKFPPRLPIQPIFYPVLNEEYAIEIARDWNTKDAASGFSGFVTRFRVRAACLARYEIKTVGARRHQEYWIPAEEQEELHRNIVGLIEVTAEFHGPRAAPKPRGWVLWRQDDFGNTFVVDRFPDRAQAESARAGFQGRGHKQLYFVEEERAKGPGDSGR
jgi:hypothetical protein